MYFAPPIDYDSVMKQIPYGKVITIGKIREYFAKQHQADFTEPITAVSIRNRVHFLKNGYTIKQRQFGINGGNL